MADTDDLLPPMEPVFSSNLAERGYDPATNRLFVRFKGGGLYAYEGVQPDTYDQFKKADSAGSFLHAVIKPAFPVKKIG